MLTKENCFYNTIKHKNVIKPLINKHTYYIGVVCYCCVKIDIFALNFMLIKNDTTNFHSKLTLKLAI